MTSAKGRITDEGVAALRAQIGVQREAYPWNSVASYDAIWHFAAGVGDDNPLWWDETYAAATRWRRMFAPPTFLYTCYKGGPRHGRPPEGLTDFEALPGVVGFWSTDRWAWFSPVWRDERVRATTELHDVVEPETNRDGRTVALIQKIAFSGADDRPLAELYSTVIYLDRDSMFGRNGYSELAEPTYSSDDIEAIHAQYEHESRQRRGGETRYWDDVAVGEEIPKILKGPLTMTGLIGWKQGWGSSSTPANRIAYQQLLEFPGTRIVNPDTGVEDSMAACHWDPYFAKAEGLPRGYDYGSQRISWFSHLLTDWCGDDGFVADLSIRLRRPNFLGDCTWLSGLVRKKAEHMEAAHDGFGTAFGSIECELVSTNQRGETTAVGTGTLGLPRRGPQGAAV